jgi:broad specificity phosphatase PhoE
MRMLIIRHPETEANVGNLIYGRTESAYTPKGLADMDWVLNALADRSVDVVYTSPMQRTARLALAISAQNRCPISESTALLEMHFGIFENMTRDQAKTRFPDYFEQYMADYSRYRIQDGESFEDVRVRFSAFISPLLETEETIVLVTHGMVMKAAISVLLDLAADSVWHFSTVPATLLEIDYRSGYGVLVSLSSPPAAATEAIL